MLSSFLKKIPFLLIIFLSLESLSNNLASSLSSEDKELEQRVEELSLLAKNRKQLYRNNSESLMNFHGIQEWLQTLKNHPRSSKNCLDHRKVFFQNKYVLTYDNEGSPCRIYDLSFPSVNGFLKKQSFFKFTTRNWNSKDYLSILKGQWEEIQKRDREHAAQFSKDITSSKLISFLKKNPQFNDLSKSQGSIPSQWTLKEVLLNNSFEIQTEDKEILESLIPLLSKSNGLEGWTEIFLRLKSDPHSFLALFQFIWNEQSTSYDAFLNGDFLPLRGPVEVINFQSPWKSTQQKAIRALLKQILLSGSSKIPDPFFSTLSQILLMDGFEQLEMLHTYQSRRLEWSLQNLEKEASLSEADIAVLKYQGLPLLFNAQSTLLNMLSISKNTPELGLQEAISNGKVLFEAQKSTRAITSERMIQELKNEGCHLELFNQYFALCSEARAPESIYSLITEQTFSLKKLGPPLIYRVSRPYEVSLKRGLTAIASIALRAFGLPLSTKITHSLNNILKDYWQSGILDEAYLLEHTLSKTTGPLPESLAEKVLPWLYVQNLNPLISKTKNTELEYIQAHFQILNIRN